MSEANRIAARRSVFDGAGVHAGRPDGARFAMRLVPPAVRLSLRLPDSGDDGGHLESRVTVSEQPHHLEEEHGAINDLGILLACYQVHQVDNDRLPTQCCHHALEFRIEIGVMLGACGIFGAPTEQPL